MRDVKPGLFVYGTLHPDRAPDEIKDVVRGMTRIGSASIRGKLYDLGDYPGLVLKGDDEIPGTVFSLPDDPGALRRLDAYEEFQPENLKESLFIRRKHLVTLSNGKQQIHWVYLYNEQANRP